MPLYNQYVDLVSAQTVGGAKTFTSTATISSGNVEVTGSQNFVLQPVSSSVSATGNTLGAAAQLTTYATRVNGGTAVTDIALKLLDVTGKVGYTQIVRNVTALSLSLYPPDGSSEINALGNGNALTILASTTVLATRVSSTLWIAMTGTT